MKNLTMWILVVMGTVSIAVSTALIYPAGAMASCTVTVNCPNGAVIQCSGDHCEGGSNRVTCTIHGVVTAESGSCPGGE